MRATTALLACIMIAMFAGCSSSGDKIKRTLFITSEPAGATVYMDGDKIGETPLKIQTFFTWNQNQPYDSLLRRVIQVKKEGYAAQSRDLFPIDMPNITFFLVHENQQHAPQGGAK